MSSGESLADDASIKRNDFRKIDFLVEELLMLRLSWNIRKKRGAATVLLCMFHLLLLLWALLEKRSRIGFAALRQRDILTWRAPPYCPS